MNTISTQIRRLTVVAAAISLFSCGGGSESNTKFDVVNPTEPVSDWVLVWGDEFDGSKIDQNKWTHEVNCEGGGNFEQQCYTDSTDNSFVSDGTLKIVAKPAEEGATLPYTSARLVTKNKGDWTYGRFEMRAKLPSGQGTWPAFWMLSTDEVYGSWPRSGEIDILEAVNLKADDNGEPERSINGQLYYGGDANGAGIFDSSGINFDIIDGSNPADDFHTYAIEWQEGEIRWYVDDYLFMTQMQSKLRLNSKGDVLGLLHKGWYAEYYDQTSGELKEYWTSAPFDQDFHLLLNLAVGGQWAANVNELGIDAAAFADGQTFEVDYVRVYECSVNPLDGSGCETIRRGYKTVASEEVPNGALVTGVAPTPPPPPGGPITPLTIFADAENPSWPLWNDGKTDAFAVVVTDDTEHGEVSEFTIGATNTVMGYNTRPAYTDSSKPYNASPMLATGFLSFEMKVVNAPSDSSAVWLLKLESDDGRSNNGQDGVRLSSSIEGMTPVVGEWQTYTFSVKSLADSGLDLSQIDVLMIFPTWGKGEGAVYRVDNVKFEVSGGTASGPSAVLFDDALADGLTFDSYNPDNQISYSIIEEGSRGQVLELVKTGPTGNVYFTSADAVDLSAYGTAGELVFDVNVTSLDAGVELLVKFDSGWPNVSDYSVTLPTAGVWAEVRINIAELIASGNRFAPGNAVDEFAVTNIFVMEPTGAMTVKFDNIRLESPGSGTSAAVTELYTDALADGLTFDSYNPDNAISYSEIEEASRGTVLEVIKTGATGNVYFTSADAVDLSAYGSTGELVFDVNVTSLDAGVELLVKFDSGWPNVSDYSVTLPTAGVWAEVRINIAELIASGNRFAPGNTVDEFAVTNIFVMEPTGAMTFKVDNIRLEIPGSGTPDSAISVAELYTDLLAEGLVFDSYNPDSAISFTEEVEEGRGTVLEVVKTGATGNVYFTAADAYDLSLYGSTGELVFDVNVLSLDGGVELLVKFDSGWPNVSDYSVLIPNIGVWTEVRINIQELIASGNRFSPGSAVDEFAVTNIFVIEPLGAMTARFDNIRFEY
jgi:beta-glucanase (GH16 family)